MKGIKLRSDKWKFKMKFQKLSSLTKNEESSMKVRFCHKRSLLDCKNRITFK